MARLALGQISNIHYVSETQAQVEMNYIGFGEEEIEQGFSFTVNQNATDAALALACADALKSRMETQHGYEFGLLDFVTVYGSVVTSSVL